MSSANQVDSTQAPAINSAERRRNLRFPFTATIEVVEIKTGTKVIGRTSDLSLGGCYMDTLSPFAVGTEAQVRILSKNETFEARVRVIYSAIGLGMGLAFISARPKHVRLFQRWLLEINGQSAPGEGESPPGAPAQVTDHHSVLESDENEKTRTSKNAVLSDLIMTLMHKKVLTRSEGKDLLRKLSR